MVGRRFKIKAFLVGAALTALLGSFIVQLVYFSSFLGNEVNLNPRIPIIPLLAGLLFYFSLILARKFYGDLNFDTEPWWACGLLGSILGFLVMIFTVIMVFYPSVIVYRFYRIFFKRKPLLLRQTAPKRDMAEDINQVFLLPGEFKISRQPYVISTLLGSCVSVCLHHPKQRCGGMNHYLLPHGAPGESENGRYGHYSIGLMLDFMQRACGSLNGVLGMIIGGADVLPVAPGSGPTVGVLNIALAREMLKEHNIRIIKEQVGGKVGMKIRYQNWDNQILVTPMSSPSRLDPCSGRN